MIISTLPWLKCLTTLSRLYRHLKCGNYFRLDVIIFLHQVLRTYFELCNLQILFLRHQQWIWLRHQKWIWSALLLLLAVLTLGLSTFFMTSNIFSPNPVLLIISGRSSRAIKDSEIFRSKILDFCSLSYLHIICVIVQLQCVGTKTYDSNQMMSNIPLSLSNLKLEFLFKGNVISFTPDDLYRRYIQYLPLLPSDAMTWSFSLVTLFCHALLLDLQDSIIKDRCYISNLSLLTTKPL